MKRKLKNSLQKYTVLQTILRPLNFAIMEFKTLTSLTYSLISLVSVIFLEIPDPFGAAKAWEQLSIVGVMSLFTMYFIWQLKLVKREKHEVEQRLNSFHEQEKEILKNQIADLQKSNNYLQEQNKTLITQAISKS